MRKLNENSEEIQKLEEEIRKLGIPYSGREPEPLYWANFRVRVMDRIAAGQKRAPWPTRLMEFFAEHVLAASISAAAACLAVAAFLALQPSSESMPQLANVVQPPSASQSISAPQASVPAAPQAQAIPSPVKALVHGAKKRDRVYMANAVTKADKSDDLALAEPLAASPSEQAVSLESLSQPELEAVLADLQSDNSKN